MRADAPSDRGHLVDVNAFGRGSAAAQTLAADRTDQALRADVARAAYGVSGAGVRIGILSDSFNVLGGYAADVTAGRLPANVSVVKEGPVGAADEGRAMAEVIHSIAPDAQLYFYTAMDGEADFANGITTLQAQDHVQVIVDDVAYLRSPFSRTAGRCKSPPGTRWRRASTTLPPPATKERIITSTASSRSWPGCPANARHSCCKTSAPSAARGSRSRCLWGLAPR
jgi:hypothetical protein